MNMKINEKFDKRYKIYIASGCGAFFLGLGDLITNDKAATVLKIGQIFREHIFSGFFEGGLVPLILLALLGAVISWVHQPKSRIDAFARGFSVFAVLAVVTPYQGQADPQGIKTTSILDLFPIISSAQADPRTERKNRRRISGKNKGIAVFRIEDGKNKATWRYANITLRDAKTEKILAERRIRNDSFSIAKAPGMYKIEIESPGYQRVEFSVQVTKQKQTYVVPVVKSSVPISIQRLLPAKEISITK